MDTLKTQKAFRYKLEPNEAQTELLYRMAGCGRVVYNDSLDYLLNILAKKTGIKATDRKALYQHLNDLQPRERIALAKGLPSAYDLNKLLTQWKKKEDRTWLKEAYTDNLQQRNLDLMKGVDAWCKGIRGFPVFRTKRLAHHSTMRFVNFTKYCSVEHKHIKLPNKLGLVRYHNSRPIEGKPRNATVSLNACGEWHISIMCDVKIKLPKHVEGQQTGIDMGIAKNITCSTEICGDGGVFVGVHAYKAYKDKLAREQRKLSRKVKGSANWLKQKAKINRIHRRITHIRNDYLHKATTDISKNHAMVICEALKVNNMSASAKGTADEPGRMVKQKAGLNRSILDQGWGVIRQQLAYKMAWKGGIYGEVAPHYTSQQCSECGHTEKANRTSQSNFTCVACGHTDNADKNAARNILKRYLEPPTKSAA
ncbi:MAG: transposase [Oceanospirillaceae bacterium]|nr:transposase [Oceanospirillaceae bacterium]